jgi:two-component system chemotaxis sensor kinase CheA
LLVSAGGEQFALAAAHVMEVQEWSAPAGTPLPEDVTIRDDIMPLVPLEERFGLAASTVEDRHLVVVDAGGGRRALLVDEITGHQDIVVKRFQGVRESHEWFSGATLLGDGRPALIVDLSSLA